MRFSMFDWLDESGRGYAETYDERLRVIRAAEEAGFYAYYLAEHHGTSLSTTPSPSLFLSAVAQHTSRLRMGALTWVISAYNPLRLLEELCMLDQMSHGRIDIGLGSGSSPHEVARHGLTHEESRARFGEVVELLRMGFTTGELNFQGKYYQYQGLKTRFRPFQKPYPPLWYPTSKPESVPRIAAQGFSIVMSLMHSPSFEALRDCLHSYRREFAKHRDDPNRLNAHVSEPDVAFTTHVHLAATDAKAREQAGAAYVQFHKNFTRRYVDIGQGDKYAHRADFGKLVAEGKLLCGSPDTVRTALLRMVKDAGANHFIGAFTFGSLSAEHMTRSLQLFAREVMPAFDQPVRAAV